MNQLFFLSLLLFSNLDACTRLFWNDNDQAKIVARTMDLFISDEPQIWVNPRGIEHKSEVDERGLKWTSVYGSVSISAFHRKDTTTDGLNEAGLAVHSLALKPTKYEERDNRPGLHYGEWPQYLLDTCKTVEEALDAHKKFQVVPFALNNFIWPLHLMIEDANGDSAIIEFIEGEMNIYHSANYQVGTNGPAFNLQLENLENYENFGGTLPFPIGSDSMSRFVLASAYLKELPQPINTDEAIRLTKQTIERLYQKDNISINTGVNLTTKQMSVSTLWTTLSDLTHRTYHFYPTNGGEAIHLDFSKLNFSEETSTEEAALLIQR
jgi:choloylglycine hydrolase